MALALTAGQIRAAWHDALGVDAGLSGFSKPDLEAAVTAVDGWCDANSASFNAALPQPFRTAATSQQKAVILAFVAMRRTGVI